MSNSPLAVYTQISPHQSAGRGLWVNGQLKQYSIDRITPHCVVGQCTIESLGNWFARPATKASSNYGIDKNGRIGLFVEEKDRSWCSSSAANDARAVTIECASDTFDPYRFTDQCYESLVRLCIDICRRNGKDKLLWFNDKNKTINYQPAPNEMVISLHRYFANKSCPGDWLVSRLSNLTERVNEALKPEEDDDMANLADFKKLWGEYRKELQDNDSANWSKEAREWAVKNGIVQGGTPLPSGDQNFMWEDMLTREQMVTLLYRFAQYMGKDVSK